MRRKIKLKGQIYQNIKTIQDVKNFFIKIYNKESISIETFAANEIKICDYLQQLKLEKFVTFIAELELLNPEETATYLAGSDSAFSDGSHS